MNYFGYGGPYRVMNLCSAPFGLRRFRKLQRRSGPPTIGREPGQLLTGSDGYRRAPLSSWRHPPDRRELRPVFLMRPTHRWRTSWPCGFIPSSAARGRRPHWSRRCWIGRKSVVRPRSVWTSSMATRELADSTRGMDSAPRAIALCGRAMERARFRWNGGSAPLAHDLMCHGEPPPCCSMHQPGRALRLAPSATVMELLRDLPRPAADRGRQAQARRLGPRITAGRRARKAGVDVERSGAEWDAGTVRAPTRWRPGGGLRLARPPVAG